MGLSPPNSTAPSFVEATSETMTNVPKAGTNVKRRCQAHRSHPRRL